jgi:DNA-directed RNA polymerase subunit RPC12/RpoP
MQHPCGGACGALACTKAFATKKGLGGHTVNYACVVCGKTGRGRVSRHMRVAHPLAGAPAFQCPHCSKTCSRREHLAVHLRAHTNERPYPCSQCDQRFKDASTRRTHEQRKHSAEAEHKCHRCDAVFCVKRDLTDHQKYHEETKRHACAQCGRHFARSSDLRRHEKRKTPCGHGTGLDPPVADAAAQPSVDAVRAARAVQCRSEL